MTETEWLQSVWPQSLLDFARTWTSERKLRLIACAYARYHWKEMPFAACRTAVETAEGYVDGEASDAELYRAREEAAVVAAGAHLRDATHPETEMARLALATTHEDPYTAANLGTIATPERWRPVRFSEERLEFLQFQLSVIREIAGNPFYKLPVSDAHRWENGSAVARLAQAIYQSQDYTILPVLGDALEESGCSEEVIQHCRAPEWHPRGWWFLDRVLGED